MPNILPNEPKAHLGEEESSPSTRNTSSTEVDKVKKIISEASEIRERYENLSRPGEASSDNRKLSFT